MPLPKHPSTIVQAPRWAGVGLRRELMLGWMSRPPASWPEDWWQRNYDDLYEYDSEGGIPLTYRHLRVPGFPYPAQP
jgi:hypothetical protein